jgi:hypothetical protein
LAVVFENACNVTSAPWVSEWVGHGFLLSAVAGGAHTIEQMPKVVTLDASQKINSKIAFFFLQQTCEIVFIEKCGGWLMTNHHKNSKLRACEKRSLSDHRVKWQVECVRGVNTCWNPSDRFV